MPQRLSLLLLILLLLPLGGEVRGEEKSLGERIGDSVKKAFATPTPTPSRHRTQSSHKKKSTPSPTPSASPTPRKRHKSSSSSKVKSSPSPEESATPKPKKKKKPSPTPEESPTATPKESPSPSESPTPSATPEESASPKESASPEESVSAEETASPEPSASASPEEKKSIVATISPNEIKGYDKNPPEIRTVLETALALTNRDLKYTYGSADPESGGMDCSGFIYYVLRENGVKDVPRDASGQYVWVRKSGNFRAVLSRDLDSFEFNELKPGDLLFWTGTYDVEKDPPVTHTMIYLGENKETGKPVMLGASDGRSFEGKRMSGVSVFDFKTAAKEATSSGRHPRFVGYGRIPGLGSKE